MTQNVLDCLKERGFIDAVTSDDLPTFCEKPQKVYVGFDPTADSLHLGNLLGIIALGWFQKYGHTPVVVLGGTTGRIGDPSGKSVERPLLDADTITHNVASIRKHFEQILDFSGKHPIPKIHNNDEWFASYGLVDFLRDVGKHFRMGPMLAKESVRARLQSEEGLSFTEFSYQLIQGYDFYFLHFQQGVSIQMGGSDQWGNITAGIELTRKLTGESVYGITWPLLTRSDGKKFGKSEGGAIWLSEEKCSPYQFYQYLVRVPDADVIKMMKLLTFMDLSEIREIEEGMKKADYEVNSAQKRLAEEVTRIVHGGEGLLKAEKVTQAAAPGKKAVLDAATLEAISGDMPSITLSKDQVLGCSYPELAVMGDLLSSKGEASRLIKNGGAYLNEEKVDDPTLRIEQKDLIEDQFLLLGAGKKKKLLIKISQ